MGEHPTELSHIPKHQGDHGYSEYLEIEEWLGSRLVFIAGFGNQDHPRRSSLCAYGTIIDHNKLTEVFPELLKTFGKDKLLYFIHTIQDYSYLSPIPSLTALWLYKMMEGTSK